MPQNAENSNLHNFYCGSVNEYRGADKSLARPISRCILSDGETISFDASLVIYVNSNNISPIMKINRIYKQQHLLWLKLVSFLAGLWTYQHTCSAKNISWTYERL
jgi:hypothetical protein